MAIGAFDQSAKERLSALADGELDSADPAAACAIWAHHPDARRDWHAWHLIGDVLRSEDLATDPRRDRRLCAAVRARLGREPVVLSPVREAPPRRAWSMGAAIAAGFVLAAGTFALVRTTDIPDPPSIAQAAGSARPPVVAAAGGRSDPDHPPEVVVVDNRLIHDARLDRYLDAHKQFAGSTALKGALGVLAQCDGRFLCGALIATRRAAACRRLADPRLGHARASGAWVQPGTRAGFGNSDAERRARVAAAYPRRG
jgi:sigma-E factor negative regulatory protein RseA